jgi:RNA polymerase sigma-70 factor (ECF subfamily)
MLRKRLHSHPNKRFTTVRHPTVQPPMNSPRPLSPLNSSAIVTEPAISAERTTIARAQAGDVAAFEVIYREHAGRVLALCRRLCADDVRGEELMQDVFVRAWEKLATFRAESSLGTWLHSLAVNLALQARRGDARRSASLGEYSFEDAALSHGQDGVARDGDPGLRMDLETAIAALPAGARRAFVLHDVHGYRHSEIARMTGLAEGTIRAQLHRARALLMEALDR